MCKQKWGLSASIRLQQHYANAVSLSMLRNVAASVHAIFAAHDPSPIFQCKSFCNSNGETGSFSQQPQLRLRLQSKADRETWCASCFETLGILSWEGGLLWLLPSVDGRQFELQAFVCSVASVPDNAEGWKSTAISEKTALTTFEASGHVHAPSHEVAIQFS